MRVEFSNKVKRDALQRANGKCENEACGASLSLNKYHYDHRIPDQMGGDASLDNCQLLCWACHKEKTKADVADIAKAKRIERRHLGIRRESRMPGARSSRLKKKVDGSVVER